MIQQIKQDILHDINFSPSTAQWPIINDFLDPVKRILITGGWRAGKSETSSVLLTLGYHLDIKMPIQPRLYWIIAADYETCRPEFKKSLNYFKKLDLITKAHFPSEGQCYMGLIGNVEIVTRSADEEWKIAEEAPDGILVVEAGRLSEGVWHRVIGRLVEKRGWCVLSGTLEGSDPRAGRWYPDLFWSWQARVGEDRSYAIPTWSNTALFPGGRTDPAILEAEKDLTEDMFQEKFGAIPVRPSGMIMKEFSNDIHVGNFPYAPQAPVEIAVDPGYGGAYAVLAIQIKESIPFLIGEVYLQGYVTEDVITKCKHEWPYFPKIFRGAIDIAAKQHQAMPAPIEVWQKLTRISLAAKHVEVEGGINLLRTFLKVDPVTKRPKLYVDKSCRGFIAECGGGPSPVPGGGMWLRDTVTGKIIDRNNHATKAMIYWLVNRFGYSPYERTWGKPKPNIIQRVATGMYK